MDREVRLANIEGLRIERSADPLHHVLVLGMPRVCKSLEELYIPNVAPNVFRRAGALSSLDHRVATVIPGRQDRLEDHIMLPAVAEVVFVGQPVLGSAKHVTDGGLILATRLRPNSRSDVP